MEERDRVLDPVISEPARDLSVLGLLLPTRETAAPFRGRAAELAWLHAWRENPDAHPVALVMAELWALREKVAAAELARLRRLGQREYLVIQPLAPATA